MKKYSFIKQLNGKITDSSKFILPKISCFSRQTQADLPRRTAQKRTDSIRRFKENFGSGEDDGLSDESLEDTHNGPTLNGKMRQHNTTASSIAPPLLANNDSSNRSPNNFRRQQQNGQMPVTMVEGGGGDGLLKPTDQRLSTAPGPNTYPAAPDRSRGVPSEMSSSYLNYLNMNSSLAERQRHSQSSDSGYEGVSPTGSQSLIRNGPLHLRSEMTKAIQCLRELTANHYKLHELLETQSRSLQKITQTIIGLKQALPYLENSQSEQVPVSIPTRREE